MKALMDGVGIEFLNDFLIQPPTAYKAKLTYVEVLEDGSTTLMALHPTYVSLLTAFYWWCRTYMQGNRMPPHAHWPRTTRGISSIS